MTATFGVVNTYSQSIVAMDSLKKTYVATRITSAPQIDGLLTDTIWNNIPLANNFSMLSPRNGEAEREALRTEFKIAYNDEAIYIAAYMFDPLGKSIRREFTQRDNVPQTDYIVIDFNTYNEGDIQTRFVVTTAGAMADAKMKANAQDYEYNVIWNTKVTIDEKGWYAEIKIPFASLRFPKKDEQIWSMQFGRVISSLNEIYMWNPVNNSVGILPHYNGLLKGIKNINPPTRLGFYPFVSGGTEYYKNDYKGFFNAGMDIKYGISDAFTLDVTLIPDFGQTAYDNVELNLGPFEQTFGEKRAFFTEGTELFNKGNLFYSRRIGQTPIAYNDAILEKGEDEVIIENPEETTLLNAFKISGRTSSGLGIGFFNAITANESARYKNLITGEIREKITSPFSNYNILVLDQQFKNNSSVSFVNTNVLREGNFRDANVSAGLFDFYTKNSAFNITGEAKVSQLNLNTDYLTGFASQLAIQRSRGNFRYGLAHDFADRNFDINDLGVNFTNNYNNFFWNTSYETFKPHGAFNKYKIELYGNHQRRYIPSITVRNGVGTKFTGSTKGKLLYTGFVDFNTKYRDFFEARTKDRYVLYPENFIGEVTVSTDPRKRFAFDTRFLMSQFINSDFNKINFNFSPHYRFTEKFSVQYLIEVEKEVNRTSYVTHFEEDVILGNRDRISFENSLQAVYNLTTEKAFSLSFRNYYTVASFYDNYYSLQDDGTLSPYDYSIDDTNNPDAHFNIWNLDLRYTWRFAPASELSILYRNSVSVLNSQSDTTFFNSTDYLFKQDLKHLLSLKLVYYIDYNNLRKIF